MYNKEKASKGLIILVTTLVIILLVTWGIALGLYYEGKHLANEENIEKVTVSKKIESNGSEEKIEDKEIILDENLKKQLEKIINKHEENNEEVDVIPSDIQQNNPDNYELNTPSYSTSKYLECWENQDWSAMVEYTQNSWAKKYDNSKEILEAQYSSKELLGAQIIDEEKQGENLTKVTYKVWYKFLDGEISIKLTVANVIREKGEWGVNPISALSEENAYN